MMTGGAAARMVIVNTARNGSRRSANSDQMRP
jgi:hypothetical protein